MTDPRILALLTLKRRAELAAAVAAVPSAQPVADGNGLIALLARAAQVLRSDAADRQRLAARERVVAALHALDAVERISARTLRRGGGGA